MPIRGPFQRAKAGGSFARSPASIPLGAAWLNPVSPAVGSAGTLTITERQIRWNRAS